MIISGYKIGEKIYESENSIIYIVYPEGGTRPFIFKRLPKEYPSNNEFARFKLEYEMSKELDLEGISKMYEVVESENNYGIIMEFIEGDSLNKLIFLNELKLIEVLDIGIKFSDILGKVHQKGIIHKDINPSNIIWNKEESKATLIDFGISSKLANEVQFEIVPSGLEGSLPYISPEQTGRMNRNIDYRTDFYSLGVTLYELLTGQKPFETEDVLEMIHCHMATDAKSPSEINSHIPSVISKIVLKLMAKNAEDRYQSSYGIRADLQKCYEMLKLNGNIIDFEIAEKDISEKFYPPQKLYGRENEVKELIDIFNIVSKKELMQILFIKGYSGIGKSSLVNEIYKPLIEKRAYFIKGKFDLITRNVPYSAFINSSKEFIKEILTENEECLKNWKQKILDAVGSIGQVIINLIPEVELIIGEQPKVLELDLEREENRFNIVFQNFIQSLATKEHPLVILLDDIQWIDMPSLRLLESLLCNIEVVNIYFIGIYRDNEVDSSHILHRTLKEIERVKFGNVNYMDLKPLKVDDICQLISDGFSSCYEDSMNLAKICFEKTQGNPFFVNQFLKSLYENNILEFDRANGCWTWDIEKVRGAEFTENVVTLMTSKILTLSKTTQDVLKLASCFGNTFDIKTLAMVNEKSLYQTSIELWAALKEGLIIPIDNNYKLINKDTEDILSAYKFLHAKVQQASYSLIDEDVKKSVHLKIGRLLARKNIDTNLCLDENIFAIVNNYNIASILLEDIEEKRNLAKLNLIAGKKARQSAAYDIAFVCFENGLNYIKDDNFTEKKELEFELMTQAAEAAYISGKLERLEYYINELYKKVEKKLDKIKIYEIEIRALVSQNKRFAAVEKGLEALSLLGVVIPSKTNKIKTLIRFLKTKTKLFRIDINDILKLPEMTDPNISAAMDIMYVTQGSAYVSATDLVPFMSFEMIDLSLKYGIHKTTYFGFGGFALVLFSLNLIEEGCKWSPVYTDLYNVFQDLSKKSMYILTNNNFLTHHYKHLKDIIPELRGGYNIGVEMGDFEYASFNSYVYIMFSLLAGEKLEVLEKEAELSSKRILKLKQPSSYQVSKIYHQGILNLLDDEEYIIKTGSKNQLGNKNKETTNRLEGKIIKSEEEFIAHLIDIKESNTLLHLYFNKLYLSILFYQFEDGISFAKKLTVYAKGKSQPIVAAIIYYEALAYLMNFEKFNKKERKKALRIAISNKKEIEKRSKYALMNYAHKSYVLEALIASIKKDESKAAKFFDKAIELASKNNYINDKALANELAGIYYLKLGRDKIGNMYLLEARNCYMQWGALAKVRHLENEYQYLNDNSNNLEKKNIMNSTTELSNISQTTTIKDTGTIDMKSLFKSLTLLSSETDYIKLIKNIIKVITENAGSQKIVLLIRNNIEMEVETLYKIGEEIIIKDYNMKIVSKIDKLLPMSIINYVIRLKEMLILTEENKYQFQQDNYMLELNPQSVICIPLIEKGEINRVLYIENATTRDVFNQDKIKILKILTSQMIISIENAYLNRRAITDGLTQINNRAFFDEYIDKKTYESQRYDLSLSLMVLDIDHFKLFNDNYGHQVGDFVLQSVAQKISSVIRKSDVVARYGGEEFVVVMPRTNLDEGKIVAEKIRNIIMEHRIDKFYKEFNKPLQVTVSIGVAHFKKGDTKDSLIKRADEKLYLAKNNGRNRVEI